MPVDPNSRPISESDRLEAAADEAIAACGGNARDAVKSLIVANEFLGSEVCELMQAVVARLRAGKIQDLYRVSIMAEVTYFVALPFASGSPLERHDAHIQ